MSESYVTPSSSTPTTGQSGKADAAKQEASQLKDTAAAHAQNVAGTAKDEAKSVAGEAKSQAKGLYAEGKRQLNDQAGTQQKRVASGLRSVGDELDSMASNSENSGVATDIVRNVSQRVGSAASWLDDRDPGSVWDEAKNFARRRPAVFIGGALVVGVIVGRLTRALAANASDEKSDDTTSGRRAGTDSVRPAAPAMPAVDTSYTAGLDTGSAAPGYGAGVAGLGAPGAGGPGAADLSGADDLTAQDTPLFTQSAATLDDERPGEAYGDDRSNSV